jgi:hypothetical protein
MPLPNDDTTPPVTNTYLVMSFGPAAPLQRTLGLVVKRDYIDRPFPPLCQPARARTPPVECATPACRYRATPWGKHGRRCLRRIVSQGC